MDEDKCLYDGDKILIEADSYAGRYTVGMTLENSYCYFTLQESVELSNMSCYKNPCIKLGQ
jgi:hypothetical protein